MDVFVGLLVLIGCCACQNTKALNDVANNISDRELLLELIHHVNVLEERGREQQKLIEEQDLEHRKAIQQMKQLIQKQNDEIQRLVEICHKDNSNMPVYKREERIRRDERVVRNSRRLFDGKSMHTSKRLLLEDQTVAFFATLSNPVLHPGEHQNIVFDQIVTNIGDAYNPHHGIFVAPVTGTYVFTPTIMANNDEEVWCELVVNNASVARINVRGTDTRHDQSSLTAVLELNAGDDVAVQTVYEDHALYGSQYSAFSGFLLTRN